MQQRELVYAVQTFSCLCTATKRVEGSYRLGYEAAVAMAHWLNLSRAIRMYPSSPHWTPQLWVEMQGEKRNTWLLNGMPQLTQYVYTVSYINTCFVAWPELILYLSP